MRNNYLKTVLITKKCAYNKQINYFLSFLRKTKNNYYANLNETDIKDKQTVK